MGRQPIGSIALPYGHPAGPCLSPLQAVKPADHAAPCANLLGGPISGTVPTGHRQSRYCLGAIGRSRAWHYPIATKTMTLKQVLQFKAAEKAAKDAFWAAAGAAGSKMTAKQIKLQGAMIAATKARQAAMTAYAATL